MDDLGREDHHDRFVRDSYAADEERSRRQAQESRHEEELLWREARGKADELKREERDRLARERPITPAEKMVGEVLESIGGLIFVILLLIGGYNYLRNTLNEPPQTTPQSEQASTAAPSVSAAPPARKFVNYMDLKSAAIDRFKDNYSDAAWRAEVVADYEELRTVLRVLWDEGHFSSYYNGSAGPLRDVGELPKMAQAWSIIRNRPIHFEDEAMAKIVDRFLEFSSDWLPPSQRPDFWAGAMSPVRLSESLASEYRGEEMEELTKIYNTPLEDLLPNSTWSELLAAKHIYKKVTGYEWPSRAYREP